MNTFKNKWSRPTLLAFNDWLTKKAEDYEQMKVTSAKPKADEIAPVITKSKTELKVLALTSKADAPTVGHGLLPTNPISCIDCKKNQILCGVAVFFVRRHQHREQKSSLTTNFAFRAQMGTTCSGSARKHASEPQKVVQALTTSCYTEPREFSCLEHYMVRTI